MPFGLRLLHLGLLLVECLNLLGHTLLSGVHSRLKGLAFALLMAGSVWARDSVKGEIARSLFYMHAEYGLSLRDMLPMLKRWNEEDPPNAHERQRNDTIEELQGIRNSFIDDPTLAGSL